MPDMIRRSFSCELKEIDEAARTIWFIASTEAVDRMGDIIRADGWQLDNYMKNPVFLWCHDRDELPLGKCIEHKAGAGQLLMKIQFATAEENPMAEQVFRLFNGGFLNAVSVGFIPIEYGPRKDDGGMGMEFIKQELFEVSAVPVPANPEALMLMVRGMDVQKPVPTMRRKDEIIDVDIDTYTFVVPCDIAMLLKAYGDTPAEWASNFESLKDLNNHLAAALAAVKAGAALSGDDKKTAKACHKEMTKCMEGMGKCCEMLESLMMPKPEDDKSLDPEEIDLDEIETETRSQSAPDELPDEMLEPESLKSLIQHAVKDTLDKAMGKVSIL